MIIVRCLWCESGECQVHELWTGKLLPLLAIRGQGGGETKGTQKENLYGQGHLEGAVSQVQRTSQPGHHDEKEAGSKYPASLSSSL